MMINEMYLSPETANFLCFEIQDMLKHCELSDKQAEDLQELLYAFSEFDQVRIYLD